MKRFLSAGEGYDLFRKRRSTNNISIYPNGCHKGSLRYFTDTQRVIGKGLLVGFFLFLSPYDPTQAQQSDRQRDLARFPMVKYDPDLKEVVGLRIGDVIPDQLWQLPLWVVNDPQGRDTVRLRDFAEQELIVLDFWATWCKPCIESVEKWITLSQQYQGRITLLPIHLDFDYKALPFAEKRGWELPVAIGEGGVVVNRYFFTAVNVGGVVLIKDGKVFAMPRSRDCTAESIGAVLSGQLDSLPLRGDFMYGEGV